MYIRHILAVSLFCGSCVSFYGVSYASGIEKNTYKMQKLLDKYISTTGIENSAHDLQQLYKQLDRILQETTNPYVRVHIQDMQERLRSSYAFEKNVRLATTSTNKFIRSDGTVVQRRGSVAVRLSHEQLIEKFGEHAVAGPPTLKSPEASSDPSYTYTPKKDVADEDILEQEKDSPSDTDEEIKEGSEEEEVEAVITIPENDRTTATDRYVLKKGRINIAQLRNKRIERVNKFRKEEHVNGYISHQPLLDKTATERSYKMRDDGTRSHKRTPESSYYDYREIDQWFRDRGLSFSNIHRATHTENVGESSLMCTEGDCTKSAEESLYRVFQYFINEKGQTYDAHYQTIVQPYFQEMGFGIAIDEEAGIIYSTMHYGTQTKRL